MSDLPPWANGPFELLLHAEGHLQTGADFDRRIALISFDNAIEVSITTYLSLHPILRGNKAYKNSDVEKWLQTYHTKLDFLEAELVDRGLSWEVDKGHMIWAHQYRNEQYHGGNKGVPETHVLKLIRSAALWIFSTLYDVADAGRVLEQAVSAGIPPVQPQRDVIYDRAIDNEYEMLDFGGQKYYASELLFGVDYDAYRDLGAQLRDSVEDTSSSEFSE